MHVFRSMLLDAPIARAWTAIRAFDGVASWNPGVTNAALETGAATATGAIRRLETGDGGVFRETLLAHSDLEHFYTYDILDSPLPVTGYVSTHRLVPVTHSDQTLSIWEGWFRCPEDLTEQMAHIVGDQIYINGMAGLNTFLKETEHG